jgi:DNA polymerase III gamma/tau subunit
VEELTRSLKRVVKGEALQIETGDLAKIAEVSGGSFRDAVKLLEELAAGGRKITTVKVDAKVSGGIGLDKLDEWLVMVYSRQTKAALDWLQKAWHQGVKPKNLLTLILDRLRQIMLCRFGITKTKDLTAIDDVNSLRQLIGLLLEASRSMKAAEIESLPLELAVAAWGQGGQTTPVQAPQPQKDHTVKSEIIKEAPRGKLAPQSVTDKWHQILEAVKPLNHSLEALLKATEPVEFEKHWLTIKVYYKFHKERLEEERYRMMIESVASKVLVCPVKIKLILAEKPKSTSNIVEVDEPDIIKTAEEIFGVGGEN